MAPRRGYIYTLLAATTGGFSICVLGSLPLVGCLAFGEPLVTTTSDTSARTATSGSSLNCMPHWIMVLTVCVGFIGILLVNEILKRNKLLKEKKTIRALINELMLHY